MRDALSRLGKDRLVVAIHDAAFPGATDDLGVGSPASDGGLRFLGFVAGLGFDTVQLGPPGEIGDANHSPYDGALFSRRIEGLAPGALASEPRLADLLDPGDLDRLRRPPASRCDHAAARAAAARLLAAARPDRLGRDAASELGAFRAREGAWLERDALYEALTAEHRHDDWRRWPPEDRALGGLPGEPERAATLRARHAAVVDRWVLAQWLLDVQERRTRREAARLGLALFGDVHVGCAPRDAWGLRPLFLPGYALGAPPSRTNPEGQPWGYPVLDPAAAASFARARFDRALEGYDGLRIDHPHGWVCPWVYRPGAPVRAGARLFETPDDPDHPELARHAIARADQIDPTVAAWSDDRVRGLDEDQLARYARHIDLLVARLRAHGRDPVRDLAVEVLSTCPAPLRGVLARHGLGRFRVAQKARLDDPGDVYRSEQAAPADWVMLGTHDTPPIRAAIQAWRADGRDVAWARHLSARLAPPGGKGPSPEALAATPAALAEAMLADLFLCAARHMVVHVGDLFGEVEPYNRPGVVDDRNWTWRVPPDFEEVHAERTARGEAPSLARAAALALGARGEAPELAEKLAAEH